jgi:ParB family chromosome partitioning protein
MEEMIVTLRLDQVVPDPDQPRKTKSEEYLLSLGKSIKAEGQQSPITVRKHPSEDGKFMIVMGECRFLASKMAKLETIKAVVREFASADDIFLAQIVENTARADLPVMEQADSYRSAMLRGIDLDTLSDRTGKSVSTISADIELAQIDDPALRKIINDGTMPKAVAREIAKLPKSKWWTAWKWASAGKNASGMKKRLEVYLEKSGQVVMGFDYSQSTQADKEEIKKAAQAFGKWMDVTRKLLGAYNGPALPNLVMSQNRKLEVFGHFLKEVKSFTEKATGEMEKAKAVVHG